MKTSSTARQEHAIGGSRLNTWFKFLAMAWIVGFCVVAGFEVLTGAVTLPADHRLLVFLATPFAGSFVVLALLMSMPPKIDLSSETDES